jgi:DNA-binding protein HU-beta
VRRAKRAPVRPLGRVQVRLSRGAGIDDPVRAGRLFIPTEDGGPGESKRRYATKMASTKMTQTQLIGKVAEGAEISKKQAKAALDAMVSTVLGEVKKNGVCIVPGIGRLVRVDRKARTGRNPATGATIKIPAKKVVKFRVAKAAKDMILGSK